MTTVILFSAASTSSLSSSSLSSSLSLCLYILLITVVPIIVIGNWLQLVVRQRQSDVPVDLTTFPAVDPLSRLAYPTQHYCPSGHLPSLTHCHPLPYTLSPLHPIHLLSCSHTSSYALAFALIPFHTCPHTCPHTYTHSCLILVLYIP